MAKKKFADARPFLMPVRISHSEKGYVCYTCGGLVKEHCNLARQTPCPYIGTRFKCKLDYVYRPGMNLCEHNLLRCTDYGNETHFRDYNPSLIKLNGISGKALDRMLSVV
jgi:hypothetical protein